MKTFRVELRVRNNLLRQRREEMGFPTVKAFCRQFDLCNSDYGRYENMKISPLSSKASKTVAVAWRRTALRIAEIFGELPEDLWPDSVLAIERTRAEILLDHDDLRRFLLSPEAPELPDVEIEASELRRDIKEALAVLTPRERSIIEQRFGLGASYDDDHTRAEIGEQQEIGAPYVSVIEAKALRKLRHQGRIKRLKAHL